jgi:hypothetical protein
VEREAVVSSEAEFKQWLVLALEHERQLLRGQQSMNASQGSARVTALSTNSKKER